jgi:hypothetical protein
MNWKERGGNIWKRVLKGAAWTVGIIVAVVALAYLILLPVAASRERAVTKRWADAGLPIAGFIEKYPAQEDSPAALALDAATMKLGISLKSAPMEMPVPPGAKVKKEAAPKAALQATGWKAVANEAADYYKTLESPQPPLAAPPEALARFLSENAPVIQDIREQLAAEVPEWHMNLGKRFAWVLPNLLGHMELTRLLVADCIAARAAGENGRALQDAEAIWRLSDGLAHRPELISELIVIAERRMLMAALRPLDNPPPIWQERLKSWDPEQGLVSSFQAEAAMWGLPPGSEDVTRVLGKEPTPLSRLEDAIGRPYLRLSMASIQECALDMVQGFQKVGLCASEEAINKAGELSLKGIPRWNIIGRIAVPDLSNAWCRVKYLRIQMELTQKVLDIKAARDAQGAWPAQVPGIEKSFCPRERWIYTVTPDGVMSIAYSGAPPSKDAVKGFRPPQEYKEGTPAKAK